MGLPGLRDVGLRGAAFHPGRCRGHRPGAAVQHLLRDRAADRRAERDHRQERAEHDGAAGADRDVPVQAVQPAADRVDLGHGDHAGTRFDGQSQLLWGTPSALAPGIAGAVKAAKSASIAVVVVSDDTESEATDRPSLNLPSAQDELISAVAAANPHTVVCHQRGRAGRDAVAVVGGGRGRAPGTRARPAGRRWPACCSARPIPAGHLPVTFPSSLSQVPASTTAQFPGNGSTVQYSEGIDVGYRWYDAHRRDAAVPVRVRAVVHDSSRSATCR